MKSTDRHDAYGVFKPVGHVIVALPSEDDCKGTNEALLKQGFDEGDISSYTPDEMRRQADIDIEQAGVLAGIGQELNLVRSHRELALKGHSFLVVKASGDDRVQQVSEVARRFHATRAQSYGRLLIEELIEVGSGERQVAESPDRGLDAQTRSGHEMGAGTR